MSKRMYQLDPSGREVAKAQHILRNSSILDEEPLSKELGGSTSPPHTYHFSLLCQPSGIINVYSSGVSEHLAGRFDASQLTGELRDQAFSHINPEVRWARYIYNTNLDQELPSEFEVELDISAELDADVPESYSLEPGRPHPEAWISDRLDVEFGVDETEKQLYDELNKLSCGDLVRFGSGINPHTIQEILLNENFISVSFYDSEDYNVDTDPATAVDVAYPDEDGSYQPSRIIQSWAYGPDDEYVLTGIVDGAQVSSYSGSEFDAELVADIDWRVNPTSPRL